MFGKVNTFETYQLPQAYHITCPQAIQFNELDATKKYLTNSFASQDVHKTVLRPSLASIREMLQIQCMEQSIIPMKISQITKNE